MTESDLRRYVRAEILNEYAGEVRYEDFSKVFDAFKHVFKVAGTAIKSIGSALVLNYDIIVAPSEKEIKEAKERYAVRRTDIEREYKEGLKYAEEALGEIEPIIFMANPGLYLAYKAAEISLTDYGAISDWFKGIGINIDDSPLPPNVSKEDAPIIGMLGGGGAPGTGRIVQQQKQLQASIDRLFGFISGEPVTESRRPLNEGLADSFKSFLTSATKNMDPKSFGISDKTVEQIYELKRKQADKYVSMLEAPVHFIEALQKSKTIEDVKKALLIMKDAPFNIEGVDKISPKDLDDSAKKAFESAKKNKSIAELYKLVGANEKMSEDEVINRVKAYQLKNLLGDAVVRAKEAILPQIETMRERFVEEFQADAPLSKIEKIAPGSELEKIVRAGVDKISNAGKRVPPS